jgi:hypothetical protein
VVTNDVSDYTNLLVRKVTAEQKLYEYHFKEKFKKLYTPYANYIHVAFVALQKQDDIRLRAKGSATRRDHFFQSLLVF